MILGRRAVVARPHLAEAYVYPRSRSDMCGPSTASHIIFLSKHRYRHCLDADQIVHTRFGESRSMVSLLHYQGRAHGLVTTSTIPDGENEFYLVETRELIDNGMAHTQVRATTSSRVLTVLCGVI